MRESLSGIEEHNIYCTTADSAAHANPTPRDHLLRQVKLSSLLGEHVYISGGHVYENPHTRALLLEHPNLLTSGIVALGLRSDCRDFGDLLNLRAQEGKLRNTQSDTELTRHLDTYTATVIKWTPRLEQSAFKQAVVTMLRATTGPGVQLTIDRVRAIDEAAKSIEALPESDARRDRVHSLLLQHAPQDCAALMLDVNVLYYTIGGRDKNLALGLHSDQYRSVATGAFSAQRTRRMSLPVEAWFEVLSRSLVVSEDVIDQLSVDALARFRVDKRPLLLAFRNAWWRTVKIAQIGPAHNDLAEHVREELIAACHREINHGRRLRSVTSGLGISSLALTFTENVPSEALRHLALLVSLASFALATRTVQERIGGAPFFALAAGLSDAVRQTFERAERR